MLPPGATLPWWGRGTILLAALAALTGPRTQEATGQWVEAPGQGWADLTVYHLDTRDNYEFNGRRREFFAEGHAVSTSVFLTVAAGLVPGVDAWVQVPYHRLRYDDARSDRLRDGIGDTNFFLRVAPLHHLGSDFPLAVRGGLKIPVGDFAVDSEVIPLGDGQRDWEVMLEVGHSFFPIPAYVNGWVGYRWRGTNVEALRKFADEAFFLGQVGGNRGAVGARVIVEGMRSSGTPVFEGVRIPSAKRSILQVTPNVSLDVGGGALSVGTRVSLRGRNLPAGTAWVLGYWRPWSLPWFL